MIQYVYLHMDVSENSGAPKSSILIVLVDGIWFAC